MRIRVLRTKRLIVCLAVLICLWLSVDLRANAQSQIDPDLLTFINGIRVIDNHCHYSPAPDAKTLQSDSPDPLGKSPAFFDARQREDHPRWIQAWRALYGYTGHDINDNHIRELFKTKLELMRGRGADYPIWVMDKIGIDMALVNAPQLGSGQIGPRFRWVPLADGFLLPFAYDDPTGNVQRRRKEVGLEKLPPTLPEYLDQIVNPNSRVGKMMEQSQLNFRSRTTDRLTLEILRRAMRRLFMTNIL
jgi:hypothetical protein